MATTNGADDDNADSELEASGVVVGKKKETTWDRITGPKLFKTVKNWDGIHSVPLVPLRVLTGLLMIHHGSEGALLLGTFTYTRMTVLL